jgi:hypothetical protein
MANHNQAQTIQGQTAGTATVKLRHSDLTAAALTEVVLLSTLLANDSRGGFVPANAVITGAELLLTEEFSGGAVATCVVELGDAGADDELIASTDVFTGAGLGLKKALVTDQLELTQYAGQVTVTTTAANVDQLDAGRVEIRIIYTSSSTDSLI